MSRISQHPSHSMAITANSSLGPEMHFNAMSELDEALRDPLTEAKFNGLKRLNAKKVAKLMAQIDLNQSEITDMKVEGKDNVRTRIIQGLKKKISYQDTVVNYLKKQVLSASIAAEEPISEAAIDDAVMRKTIGGPKRFRPVSRTQIEKKIADLEKKINGAKLAKEANKDRAVVKPRENFNKGPDAEEKAAKILRIKMSEENAAFQRVFEANIKKIQYLTDLLQTMRNRSGLQSQTRRPNSSIVSEDEYNKTKMHNDELNDQLERSLIELAVAEEELLQTKSDSQMAAEYLQLEYDRLSALNQKSMRQNQSILKRMAELETELDQIISGTVGANLTTKAFATKAINADSAAGRCQQLKIDIKQCQQEIKELEEGVEITNCLKDAIRVKNEEIRELKRSMHELARLESRIDGEVNS